MFVNVSKNDRKKTAFLWSENAVFFQENEELVVLRLRFPTQKTSFSSEKTPSFPHGLDFISRKMSFRSEITSKHRENPADLSILLSCFSIRKTL